MKWDSSTDEYWEELSEICLDVLGSTGSSWFKGRVVSPHTHEHVERQYFTKPAGA